MHTNSKHTLTDIVTTGLNWPRTGTMKMQTYHINSKGVHRLIGAIILNPGFSHFALRSVCGGNENTTLAGKMLNPIPANSLASTL